MIEVLEYTCWTRPETLEIWFLTNYLYLWPFSNGQLNICKCIIYVCKKYSTYFMMFERLPLTFCLSAVSQLKEQTQTYSFSSLMLCCLLRKDPLSKSSLRSPLWPPLSPLSVKSRCLVSFPKPVWTVWTVFISSSSASPCRYSISLSGVSLYLCSKRI